MIQVMVPVGCRSDEGLSAPIIRRMEQHPEFVVYTCRLDPGNFVTSYQIVREWLGAANIPDLALIVGDRIEMVAAATAFFHANVPIGHVYAGVTNTFATHDDIGRHMITLMSDMQFCESKDAAFTVLNFLTSVVKRPECHITGITHLDDLNVDESLVPVREYDLVLYNPVTRGEAINDQLRADLVSITRTLNDGRRRVILIGPNPDPMLDADYSSLIDRSDNYYVNLPRSQFLGLLKCCSRFITNSSAAYYEAPYFLTPQQIVLVGPRNLSRSRVGEIVPGGSDLIVEEVVAYVQARRHS